MSDPGNGQGLLLDDPRATASEALADLAAVLRGGGHVGADPQRLAALFGDALRQLAARGPVTLVVAEQGLVSEDGQPFWAGDLLARRVAAVLVAQGLTRLTVTDAVDERSAKGLAVLLARDWGTDDKGALESVVVDRDIPGVDLVFHHEVPEVLGGGQEPSALLGLLRSPEGARSDAVAPALARIREAMNRPVDVSGAVAGAGMGARQRLEPEVRAIEEERDIGAERLGRLVFELLRLDNAGLQAADSFRLVVDHYEHLLAQHRPREAFALVRRALSLADPATEPDWPHRKLLEAELGALFETQALRRLVTAANADVDGAVDPWRQLLFLLGGVLPLDRVADSVGPFAELERAPLRQAVADGLVLDIRGNIELLGQLLGRTEGAGQAILLLAIGRLDAPTLLEKVLARMDSTLPVVRQAAMVALRKHRSPRTQEVVRRAIEDSDPVVRIEALRYVSVYHDADAAPIIMRRLRGLAQGEAEADELRALGLAFAHIARQEGVLPLTRLAQEAGEERSDAATAAIIGLASLGASGQAAVKGLVRGNAELRRIAASVGVTE